VCQYACAFRVCHRAGNQYTWPHSDRAACPRLRAAPVGRLLLGAALDEQSAARLAALLRTLADPARLRILSLLQTQPSHEACVCHVTDQLGLAQPTVSHHLRVLFEAGLEDRERRGNCSLQAPCAGCVAGAGLLLQANLFDLTWRPIFLMNLPLGLVALVGGAILIRESRSKHPLRLDLGGVALATTGLLLILYPLVQGRDLGWPLWTFVATALSIPVFVAFALYERARTSSHSALVPLTLFKQRAFVGGLVVAFTLFSGIVAFFIVYSIFIQGGLGLSPLQAGLTALAWPLGIGIARVAPRFD
jgi:Bacterial regulatory protein, arsR family